MPRRRRRTTAAPPPPAPVPDPVPWPKGLCGCRNHLGKPKVKYRSRQAAVEAILLRHLHHGAHEVVPCSRMAGVWHVRSRSSR